MQSSETRTGVPGPNGVDRSNFGTQNFAHPRRVARKTSPGASAIPPEVLASRPRPVDLDSHMFTKCLVSAPAGSSSGPGGCTYEMLKVLPRRRRDDPLVAPCC